MLNPIKTIKKLLSRPALTTESAPASESASIAAYLDPYTKIIQNEDPILLTRGGGDLKVYQEVLRDDQVKSTFQQRRLSVISKQWIVEAGGKDAMSKAAADALSANIKNISWDAISDKMLFAVMHGYAVGEVIWEQQDNLISIADIKVRDRNRFKFNVDGELYLIKADFQYAAMPDRKFWVVSTGADTSDNPYGLGLAHWLYWPVFFKRNGIKFWLIFLEKFGQPTAVGKLPTGKENDQTMKNKVLAALKSIATDVAITVPEGTIIELIEAKRSGAADYEALKDAMDAAIAKIVLSQTMTTDDGSSHSQSETHAGVRDMVIAADADMLCESFNQSVVKWWWEYNQAAFPDAKQPRIYRQVKPAADLNKTAERDKNICELGYEPTEEYIRETYGEGWQKKQVQPQPVLPVPNPNPDSSNFAENPIIDLIKLGQRSDQVALLDAANKLATNYQGVIGDRVQQLLDYAESSHDFETFQKRLNELVADLPSQQTVEKIEQASFFSRLLGMNRGQK